MSAPADLNELSQFAKGCFPPVLINMGPRKIDRRKKMLSLRCVLGNVNPVDLLCWIASILAQMISGPVCAQQPHHPSQGPPLEKVEQWVGEILVEHCSQSQDRRYPRVALSELSLEHLGKLANDACQLGERGRKEFVVFHLGKRGNGADE